MSIWAADAERGLGGTDAVGARQWDRRLRLGATAAHEAGGWRLEADGHVQRTRLRYAAPFPSDRPDAIDDTGRTATAALDLRAHRDLAGGTWTAALSGNTGRAEHPSLADAATDRSAALALAGRQPLGAVTLFPALRADLYAPDGGERRLALAPQLGANVVLADRWRLKASAARAFRMPTLNDRYWQLGGNPDLRPETAWSADLGAAFTAAARRAEVTAFATTARDQIVWSPTAAGFWAPQNVARTRALGLEASAQTALAVRLAGRAGLATAGGVVTLTDARDLDTEQPLRYTPRLDGQGVGRARSGRLAPGPGRALGRRPLHDLQASRSLPAHLVLDGQVSTGRAVGALDLRLALAAENLTGLDYQVIRSFPMPPRHARLRLTLSPR